MNPAWTDAVLYVMALLGTAAAAITGALAAGRRGMDLFGIVLLGVTAGIGGGTLRDLLINAHPVFWIADVNYLHTAIVASLAAYLRMQNHRVPSLNLTACDAVALALFSVVGAEKARSLGVPLPACALAGLLTGVFGGVLRDVFTARQPYITKSELYATTSLAGASFYLLLADFAPDFAAPAGVTIVLLLRLGAVRYGWTLPTIKQVSPS